MCRRTLISRLSVVLKGQQQQPPLSDLSYHLSSNSLPPQIVREHYLRTDIWCGSALCTHCDLEEHDRVLGPLPESPSNKYKFPHYLILDTNVVLDQIDVLEEDILKNVIILHTVLDEVKHKSSVVYKKLRDILKRPSRQFYVFVNEHHK